MRTTQFIGLNGNAFDWLDKNCIIQESLPIDLEPIYGMFEEEVHILKQYTTNENRFVEEYVQAEPWSSGPCIFLALRYSDTKEPIEESLYLDSEIENV